MGEPLLLAKAGEPPGEEELSALGRLDAAVDTALPAVSRAVGSYLSGMRDDPALTGATGRDLLGRLWETGHVPRELREWAGSRYAAMWAGALAGPVQEAAVRAERDLGLGVGASREVLVERGEELPRLLSASQATAWRIAREEARRAGIGADEGVEILRVVSGLSREGVPQLVRGHALQKTVRTPPEWAAQGFKDLQKAKLRQSTLSRAGELLKRRARVTAEYELARGYNAAKRLSVVQAMKIGLVREVERTWITQRDGDVCGVCAPLHGATMRARSWRTLYNTWRKGLAHPPAHMKCRCAEFYRILDPSGTKGVAA